MDKFFITKFPSTFSPLEKDSLNYEFSTKKYIFLYFTNLENYSLL